MSKGRIAILYARVSQVCKSAVEVALPNVIAGWREMQRYLHHGQGRINGSERMTIDKTDVSRVALRGHL